MNLSNVKSIVLPEGNVSGIAIGGANVWSAVKKDKYTWDAVFASIDAGTYATDYAIGDTVPLDLGSEGVVNMQIAAFDADDKADGSGKAPISWISKELLKSEHRINPARVANDDGTYQEGTGSIGGWEKCEMRTYLNDTIKPLIPESVRNRIATVSKVSFAYDTTGSNVKQTTQDSVWIPSQREVFGYSTIYGEKEALTYREFFDKFSKERDASWWSRTAHDTEQFRYISGSGIASYNTTSTSCKIVIGFCT